MWRASATALVGSAGGHLRQYQEGEAAIEAAGARSAEHAAARHGLPDSRCRIGAEMGVPGLFRSDVRPNPSFVEIWAALFLPTPQSLNT